MLLEVFSALSPLVGDVLEDAASSALLRLAYKTWRADFHAESPDPDDEYGCFLSKWVNHVDKIFLS
jgi:hypothetical protein